MMKDLILFLTHPPARGKSATERVRPRQESRDREGSVESETPSSAAHRRNCSMVWCSESILLLLLPPGFVIFSLNPDSYGFFGQLWKCSNRFQS